MKGDYIVPQITSGSMMGSPAIDTCPEILQTETFRHPDQNPQPPHLTPLDYLLRAPKRSSRIWRKTIVPYLQELIFILVTSVSHKLFQCILKVDWKYCEISKPGSLLSTNMLLAMNTRNKEKPCLIHLYRIYRANCKILLSNIQEKKRESQ